MDNSFSRWKSKVENKIRLYRVQVLHLSFVSRLDPTPSNKPCLRPTCMSPASFDTLDRLFSWFKLKTSANKDWTYDFNWHSTPGLKTAVLHISQFSHRLFSWKLVLHKQTNSGTYLRTEVGILSIQLHRIHHILPTYHLLIKRGLKEHLKRNCLLQAGVQQELIFYKFKVFTFHWNDFRCPGQQ